MSVSDIARSTASHVLAILGFAALVFVTFPWNLVTCAGLWVASARLVKVVPVLVRYVEASADRSLWRAAEGDPEQEDYLLGIGVPDGRLSGFWYGPLSVTCPKCGAEPNTLCRRTASDSPDRSGDHPEREVAFAWATRNAVGSKSKLDSGLDRLRSGPRTGSETVEPSP